MVQVLFACMKKFSRLALFVTYYCTKVLDDFYIASIIDFLFYHYTKLRSLLISTVFFKLTLYLLDNKRILLRELLIFSRLNRRQISAPVAYIYVGIHNVGYYVYVFRYNYFSVPQI